MWEDRGRGEEMGVRVMGKSGGFGVWRDKWV